MSGARGWVCGWAVVGGQPRGLLCCWHGAPTATPQMWCCHAKARRRLLLPAASHTVRLYVVCVCACVCVRACVCVCGRRVISQLAASVVEVTVAAGIVGGVPVSGGLYDPALGVWKDVDSRCPTCGCVYTGAARATDCTGHFGHVEVRRWWGRFCAAGGRRVPPPAQPRRASRPDPHCAAHAFWSSVLAVAQLWGAGGGGGGGGGGCGAGRGSSRFRSIVITRVDGPSVRVCFSCGASSAAPCSTWGSCPRSSRSCSACAFTARGSGAPTWSCAAHFYKSRLASAASPARRCCVRPAVTCAAAGRGTGAAIPYMYVSVGCCWLLLVAAGCCWLLLVAAACCCMLLLAAGTCM
jgi:hypothetical protein